MWSCCPRGTVGLTAVLYAVAKKVNVALPAPVVLFSSVIQNRCALAGMSDGPLSVSATALAPVAATTSRLPGFIVTVTLCDDAYVIRFRAGTSILPVMVSAPLTYTSREQYSRSLAS